MLVFLDSKGAVTATAPSTTGRNSAAMSTIYIVAPISGAVMSLSFRLPNGDEVNPDLAEMAHNAVEILEGVDLPAGVHVWTYAIPKSVTAISGTVMYTVTTTTESFVATGSGTFVVAPATTKTLPSSAPGANVWEDILAELARIYAEMETVLGDSPVTGLDGLSATVTALLSEIAALIGNTPIESPIGGETTISTLLAWLKDESLRFSEVIGSGSISFAGNLIEAVNTLLEISVVKTSDPSRVYATASDGTPAFLPYSESPTAYSIPQRDGSGRVKTASPESDTDAVDFGTFSDEQERVGNLISALQTAVNQLSRAVVFDNWDTALTELTRLTPSLAEAAENFKIGDAILIRDVDAPDGWVSGYAVTPMPYPGGNNIQNPFDGTNSFTVGWLIISPLEAPKISLDGYATIEQAQALADAAESEAKDYVNRALLTFDPPSADKVERLEAQVANLTAQIAPEYFETDASVAYGKTVPSGVLPYAEVTEVGGMSYAKDGEIKSAAVTAIESVGVNILDISAALNGALTDNGDGTYTITRNTSNDRFSAIFPLYVPVNGRIYTYVEIVTSYDGFSGSIPIQMFGEDGKTEVGAASLVNNGAGFAITNGAHFARLYLNTNAPIGGSVTFRNPMIKYGTASAPYTPYTKHTLTIPLEVQNLDGWGEGIDAATYNRIVWDPENGVKQYRQEVEKIRIDGTEGWSKTTASHIFQAGTPLAKLAGNTQTIRPIISNGYGFSDWYNPDASVKPYFRIVPNGDRLWIEATVDQFADLDAWKAYLSANPVEIVYPLASPIVTDLPTVLDDNNFIKVEEGGTITAANEHWLAAPTTVIYQKKEATA